MNHPISKLCPECGQKYEEGFAHRTVGLSFVAPEKLEKFLTLDEDLAGSGLKRILPSLAEYFRSYLCRGCQLYLIDFGTVYCHRDAKVVAQEILSETQS